MNAHHSDFIPFFEPRAVAVVGSLREPRGEALTVVRNMQHFGFDGPIYPINPSYSEILGLRVHSALEDVAQPVDLAMLITPPNAVARLVEQCARKGTKAVIIGTEGFAERGAAGRSLQKEIVDLAHIKGVRLLGPNTVGLVNTSNGLVTVPYMIGYDTISRGGVAYASQSGFVGAQGQPLEDRAYPISKMCDFGNKCDLNEADLLDYLLHDCETKAIALHMESVSEASRLRRALTKVIAAKPVLIFKTGRTVDGARASSSHTGSLASTAQVFDALFKQTGAIRLNTWQEYWEVPKLLSSQPLARGNRVGIVTATGGVGVAVVDVAVEHGLAIARLSDRSKARLASLGIHVNSNPVDLGPSLVVNEDPLKLTEDAVSSVLADPDVDLVHVVLPGGVERWADATVRMFERLKPDMHKPLAVYLYGTSTSVTDRVIRQLDVIHAPAYADMDTAVKALAAAAQYASVRSRM